MASSASSWATRYPSSICNGLSRSNPPQSLRSRTRSRQRKKQVDKALCGRLRLMVCKPRTLIGFDEDIVRLARRTDHEVNADDGNIDCPRRLDRGVHQTMMHDAGDVMDRAARVEVCSLAHHRRLALFQDGIVGK